MKSSKFVCRAAIIVQTVSKLVSCKITHGNEAANCKRLPITVDTLGENKRYQTSWKVISKAKQLPVSIYNHLEILKGQI